MGDIGKAVDVLIQSMIAVIVVAVPLAIWKLVDIAIWLFNNVEINLK